MSIILNPSINENIKNGLFSRGSIQVRSMDGDGMVSNSKIMGPMIIPYVPRVTRITWLDNTCIINGTGNLEAVMELRDLVNGLLDDTTVNEYGEFELRFVNSDSLSRVRLIMINGDLNSTVEIDLPIFSLQLVHETSPPGTYMSITPFNPALEYEYTTDGSTWLPLTSDSFEIMNGLYPRGLIGVRVRDGNDNWNVVSNEEDIIVPNEPLVTSIVAEGLDKYVVKGIWIREEPIRYDSITTHADPNYFTFELTIPTSMLPGNITSIELESGVDSITNVELPVNNNWSGYASSIIEDAEQVIYITSRIAEVVGSPKIYVLHDGYFIDISSIRSFMTEYKQPYNCNLYIDNVDTGRVSYLPRVEVVYNSLITSSTSELTVTFNIEGPVYGCILRRSDGYITTDFFQFPGGYGTVFPTLSHDFYFNLTIFSKNNLRYHFMPVYYEELLSSTPKITAGMIDDELYIYANGYYNNINNVNIDLKGSRAYVVNVGLVQFKDNTVLEFYFSVSNPGIPRVDFRSNRSQIIDAVTEGLSDLSPGTYEVTSLRINARLILSGLGVSHWFTIRGISYIINIV
jgi:hypothetical protein